MEIITLPDALNRDTNATVQVFEYFSSQNLAKQQIILNQNTFSFLIEGSKEVVFSNAALSIDNSRFLLMKTGHCLMTEKLSKVKNYRSLLFFFTNETLLKYLQKNKSKIIEPTKYKSAYSFEYDGFIHRFVKSLIDISNLSKEIQTKLLEVKFEEIMLYLTAIYGADFLNFLFVKRSDTSQNFIRIIEANSLNKLTLKELSFLCNMSVSTFKREFEKHFSESPIKWFQNKRIEYAHYLLSQEQKTATEIYLEIGYENLSSFIQAYKLKYGVTPKQNHKK